MIDDKHKGAIEDAYRGLVAAYVAVIQDAVERIRELERVPPRPLGKGHTIEEGHEWDRVWGDLAARWSDALGNISAACSGLRDCGASIHNCDPDALAWQMGVLSWVRTNIGV